MRFASQPLQIRKNQFWQDFAIAPFQNAERRDAQFRDGLAQPMEIFRFQRLVSQRISSIGVETSGDGDQLRFELLQSGESLGEGFPISVTWSVRRKRIVEAVLDTAGSCAR